MTTITYLILLCPKSGKKWTKMEKSGIVIISSKNLDTYLYFNALKYLLKVSCKQFMLIPLYIFLCWPTKNNMIYYPYVDSVNKGGIIMNTLQIALSDSKLANSLATFLTKEKLFIVTKVSNNRRYNISNFYIAKTRHFDNRLKTNFKWRL